MLAICDRCGFEYRHGQLRKEWTGFMVCHGAGTNDCWEPRHPQEFVRGVRDDQGIRPNMRPEPADVYLDHDGLTLLTSAAEDISDSYWTKGGTTVTTGRDGPWGAVTAEAAFETSANSSHNVAKLSTINLVTETEYIMEAVASSIGGRWLSFGVYNSGFSAGYAKNFNPSTGEIGSTTVAFGGLVTLISVTANTFGNDFYRCRLRFTVASAAALANLYWSVRQGNDATGTYAGDTSKGIDFYSIGLYRVD